VDKKVKITGSVNLFIINIGIILLLMSLFAIFITYTQFINTVINIKNDLYYITQNGILSANKESLSLYNYEINLNTLKKNIEDILIKNYVKNGGAINNIKVKNIAIYIDSSEVFLHTRGRYKKPIIHIEIEVKFVPVIKKINAILTHNIIVHEDVKISMLEYEVN